MIQSQYRNGRYGPVIICDICEQRIENAKLGAVVGLIDPPPLSTPLYAHKGKCHDEAEAKLGGKLKTGWEEMSRHLLYLAQNAGLTLKDLIIEAKTADELARAGF